MICHLRPLVPGQRFHQLGRKIPDRLDQRGAHMISGTAERKRDNRGEPARPLHQGPRRGCPVLTHNEITLPVPGNLAICDLGGTVLDRAASLQYGRRGSFSARAAYAARGPIAARRPDGTARPSARRTSRCKSPRATPPPQPARRTGRTSTGPPPDPGRIRRADRTQPGSAGPGQRPSSGLSGGIAPPPPATAPGAPGISPARHLRQPYFVTWRGGFGCRRRGDVQDQLGCGVLITV
jgi:hypothetical protein